ncbi:hypothetical protein [Paenibacillus elgii]|uniref:hypothetical protein n=1 Tax=Paenibacillus elgii TaxID=189691 RepID=UPI000248C25C|nr:hypothetical protein [Paenibacillus elgii]
MFEDEALLNKIRDHFQLPAFAGLCRVQHEEEPDDLRIGLAEQAGEWLGAMHRIADQAPVPIPFTSESPWSLFGQEDELDQDAQALEKALQTSGAEPPPGARVVCFVRRD